MVDLDPLRVGPKIKAPQVRNAYRFLRGAHNSVSGLFDAVQTVSDARRSANSTAAGRMKQDEVDLLRSAIVFTSSGLDAAMKRLVNDAGRHLIVNANRNGARAQYESWIRNQLAAPSVDAPLRDAVVALDATEKILDYYLAARTKASFQGSGDLESRVRKVLGIPGSRISTATLESLDPFFLARNSIVHSLDYENPHEVNTIRRKHRAAGEVATLCNGVFAVAADIMHATAEVISVTR